MKIDSTLPIQGLIYNGVHSPMAAALLERICSSSPGLKRVLATASIAEVPRPQGLEAFEVLDFNRVIQAGYDGSRTPQPLDADVLDRFGKDWFTLLKMLDRMPPATHYGFESRMGVLFRHIRYWNDRLKGGAFDCFVALNYPHEVFDYVIYVLCRSYGIRTLFFSQTQIDGFVQLFEDVEENDPALALPESPDGVAGGSELTGPMLDHWLKQTKDFQAPFYMNSNFAVLNAQNSLASRIRDQIDLARRGITKVANFQSYGWGRAVTSIHYKKLFGRGANDRLALDYNLRCGTLKPDLPYLYLPLHYQPECTTSPQGGYYVYQHLMVEMLSFLANGRFQIAIKEHPMQLANGRAPDFYQRIANLPGVVLVPRSMSSQELIEKCAAVATVTGTAGWEALFKGKAVLLFGHIFYQFAPGVIRVRTIEDCRAGLDAIFRGSGIADFCEDLKRFLAHIEGRLIRAWVDPVYEPVSRIGLEENLSNLLCALQVRME